MSAGQDSEWPSIPAMAGWAFAHHGPGEAVVEPADAATGRARVAVSWVELGELSHRAARAFLAAGVNPGDRVGLWAPNGLDWIVAMLGVQAAGGVLVPLSTRYKGREAAYILGRCRATVLVAAGHFLGTDYPVLLEEQDLPALRHRVCVGSGAAAPEGWIGWEEFLERGADVAPTAVSARTDGVVATDMSDLMFTSGTTGNPKGVIALQGQSLRVFREWADIVGLRAGDRYLIVNPMSHTFGYKAGILACLMTGATMLPLASFDADAVLDAVTAERISVIPGPPTLYQSLLDHPRRGSADLSSLRLAVTGAAVIPTELVRRILDDLGFEAVLTAYGLTESCGCISACRRSDPVETIALTSGRAFSGVEVKVVDDSGRSRPAGEPGEILCRGYNVMPGYFEDPGATAEAIDTDGWLHTGDIGTMDEAGNIRITDRKKDMFIVGGFNVYPAEVENLLLHHPDIAQAAVVGVPDERMGEVGVAYVVPARDSGLDAEAVRDWARREMANYKVPRRVVLVDALPLNASGKVLKYELRQRAGQP